jgi:hypothetical protein
MYKVLVFIFLFSQFSILPQDKSKLGEKEVKDSEKVKFINRSTKKASETAKKKNEDIGKKLSDLLDAEPNKEHSLGGVRVKRVKGNKENLYGADIVSLEEDSSFGHINSIYRILSGFIEKSFNYKEEDADIIALYVLYYNAMHRNEKTFFKTRYSDDVVNLLDVKTTGIAKNFSDWPGRTQIVIPLEPNPLKEKLVDANLDELGKEVNKIIDEKKKGPEEKKKFEEVVKEKIKEEKKAIEAKKEELKVKEEKIAIKEKELESKTKPTEVVKEEPKREIAKVETSKEPIKEIAKVENKPAPEREVKIEKAPEKTVEVKKEAEVKKLEKELVDTKKELAKVIAKEEKKKEFSENVIDGKIVFLKVIKYDTNEGHFNSELHLLDPEKDNAVLKSDFNRICSRIFKEFGGNLVVVGFKDGHKDEHQLYLINKKDLKEVGHSTNNVFSRTVIEINGEDLYAFEFDKGSYFLSKFDKSLRRVLKSDKEVFPDSNITFYGKKIYVTGKSESGNSVDIRVFNKENLKFITKIQP